jgi:hypothetical protein
MWILLRTRATLPALIVALLSSAACNDSSPSPAASATLGPAGGTIEVTSGSLSGTSIVIPAGALSQTTVIGIYTGNATTTRGTDVVGSAVRLSPTGQQLAAPASYTIPFGPARLGIGTVAADIAIAAQRTNRGSITTITPTSVDLVAGRATFSSDSLATFWATAPSVYRTDRYFVLGDGNRYEFDGGTSLDVTLSTGEPGLEGRSIWRLVFNSAFFARTGVYLEVARGGGLDLVGQFDAPLGLPAIQELVETPFMLLSATERVGNTRTTPYDYRGFSVNRPNPPVEIYAGSGSITVTVVSEGSLSTPVGRFDPVLMLEFESEFVDDRPAAGSGLTRLWLALDVGPVMFQRGAAAPQGLVQAFVNGTLIR